MSSGGRSIGPGLRRVVLDGLQKAEGVRARQLQVSPEGLRKR